MDLAIIHLLVVFRIFPHILKYVAVTQHASLLMELLSRQPSFHLQKQKQEDKSN